MTLKEWNKKGHWFSFKNAKIHYIEEGKGETLVLIHGFPTSSWDFAWVFPELAKNYHCICSDLIGLGSSSTSNHYISIVDQAEAIEALLASKGIKQAHIFAHDLGDTVAIELMCRAKEGISNLKWNSCALMNGGIFQETNSPRLIQRLLDSPIGFLIGRLSFKMTFVKTMQRIFGEYTPPSMSFLDTSWDVLIQNNGRKILPIVGRYLTERKQNKKRWEEPLFYPILPLAMINGVLDPISGKATVDRFEAKVPNGKTYRLDLGHYPHVEGPKAVLKVFHSFHSTLEY
ncbi:MAG: alpha/beta hydrolase [Flavobacteriaceae bacterium]|nr:alpha/beta hydrolase [Flavobacteriaceae bacterium]